MSNTAVPGLHHKLHPAAIGSACDPSARSHGKIENQDASMRQANDVASLACHICDLESAVEAAMHELGIDMTNKNIWSI
jgi:hypothetical protein